MRAPEEKNPPLAGSLLVWIFVQLITLIAGASRLRLWAHFPQNGESIALSELLVVQILTSSLLFPLLCRTHQNTVAILLASLPFIALASFLSASPLLPTALSAGFLALWLVGLAMWCKVANTQSTRMLAVALISGINIVGVVLSYMSAELNGTGGPFLGAIPLIGAVRMANGADYTGFSGVFAFVVLACAAHAIRRVRLSTTVIP